MPRALSIILIACVIGYVASDKIVVGALQKIFPYAAPAKVKTLTTNVNKQTVIAKTKTVVKKWVPANWKAAGVTVNASNPLSKQAYALNKALTFIDYRYSLKKYINYLYNQAIKTKYLTKSEAEKMRKMFWTADAKADNNYSQASVAFMTEVVQSIVKSPPIQQSVGELTVKFAKANPKDYANLQWTL